MELGDCGELLTPEDTELEVTVERGPGSRGPGPVLGCAGIYWLSSFKGPASEREWKPAACHVRRSVSGKREQVEHHQSIQKREQEGLVT